MNGKVKKILKSLIFEYRSDFPVDASIVGKILKKGIGSLSSQEVSYFDNFILPEIKRKKLDCRLCGKDVCGMNFDDFCNFVVTSHCQRCSTAKKLVRIMRFQCSKTEKPLHYVQELFEPL